MNESLRLLECGPGEGTRYKYTYEGGHRTGDSEESCDLILSEARCKHAALINTAFDPRMKGYSGNGTMKMLPKGCVRILPYSNTLFGPNPEPNIQYILNLATSSTRKPEMGARTVCRIPKCSPCPKGSYSPGGADAICKMCPTDRPFTNFKGTRWWAPGADSISLCSDVDGFWAIMGSFIAAALLLYFFFFLWWRKWLKKRYIERQRERLGNRLEAMDSYDSFSDYEADLELGREQNLEMDEERIRQEERERCEDWRAVKLMLEIEEKAFRAERKITDRIEENLHNGTKVPPGFVCPISKEIMIRPVIASDGYTYETKSIQQWFDRCGHRCSELEWTSLRPNYFLRSPVTNLRLPDGVLVPNYGLRSMIESWKEETLKVQEKPNGEQQSRAGGDDFKEKKGWDVQTKCKRKEVFESESSKKGKSKYVVRDEENERVQ